MNLVLFMQCEGYAFTDVVTGYSVYYWRDRKGRRWLAESRFSLFKVRV